MSKRLGIFLIAIVLAFCALDVGLSHSATKPKPAKKAPDALPLHLGSHGPRVVLLQKLLDGEKKTVFSGIKPTLHAKPNGLLGAKTELALFAFKYRLGYPDRFNHKGHSVAGADFFSLLAGKTNRTKEMVAWAQIRIQAVEAGSTVAAQQIKRIENSQLGASEQPAHSNCGPIVSLYFRAFGIGCGLPWCAVFQQWAFRTAGFQPFANRSFYVQYIADWAEHYRSKAHPHGLLTAKAKVGALVAFLDDGGHIGYVVKVMASGYVTDEGNSSDRVNQVYHPWNARLRVFILIPGVGTDL